MAKDKELRRRIIELAEKDGMPHEALLDQKIYMTREQYYRACIAAFDQGKAEGYAQMPVSVVIKRGIVVVLIWAIMLSMGIGFAYIVRYSV